MLQKNTNSGFTLVELAIVLVIIGLLVGGVLQGQELIKQAQIRSSIRAINEVKLALATFRTKYDDLPGDIKKPERFFSTCTIPWGVGTKDVVGNGDGDIYYSDETECVWMHMNVSGVYRVGMTKALSVDNGNYPFTDIDFETTSFRYAKSPVKEPFYMYISGGTGSVQAVFAKLRGVGLRLDSDGKFSRTELFGIDNKMDDGKPGTGSVRSIQLYPVRRCFDTPGFFPNDASQYTITTETAGPLSGVEKSCDPVFKID